MDQRTNNLSPTEEIEEAEPAVAVSRAVQPAAPAKPKPRRRWLRPLLLIAGPLAVIVGGAWWYYTGGRYVETDNAYVQADMVNISPQISGPISNVAVHENQHVKAGDVLFHVQRRPFEIAVEQAKANLASTAQDLNALKETYKQQQDSLALAKINLDYAQRKYDRQATLEKNSVVSQQTLDDTKNALDAARQQVVLDEQAMQTTLAKLGGSANMPVGGHSAISPGQGGAGQGRTRPPAHDGRSALRWRCLQRAAARPVCCAGRCGDEPCFGAEPLDRCQFQGDPAHLCEARPGRRHLGRHLS